LHTAHYIVAVGDVLTYDGGGVVGVFESIVAIIFNVFFLENAAK
jgi:hypothetical protein